MGTKLFVTTDFSKNSKGAMRFAIQMATLTKQELVFFHCLPVLRPTRWSEAQYTSYARAEREKTTVELDRFVISMFRDLRIKPAKYQCIVGQSSDVKNAIIREAEDTGAGAICISTRGAGVLKKMIGSNTSSLIGQSPLPVFVIPGSYRRTPIRKILYASDLSNLSDELRSVRDLGRKLKAKVLVLHYDYLADLKETRDKLDRVVKKYKNKDVIFKFRKYHMDKSLAQHLVADMKASRAALTVLFTNQKRGWFDKLFLSSKSVDVAYVSKVPLLIIPRS